MRNHPRRRSNAAFTLVELLLVVVIIGILAGMLYPSLAGRSQQARVARAKSDLRTQGLAVDMFEQDVGRFPTAEEGLKALMEDPGVPGWHGPYLRQLKDDPWGNPYSYQMDPTNPRNYVMSCAGPDGQFGTEDDI
jgi:general secretion pathway protein G